MTEAQEQEALIQRTQYHPIARLIYAIPNDGKRSVWQGLAFKRRGLKPGMPDLCLPYPSGQYHALYIELKNRNRRNHATKAQKQCMEDLRQAGNRCEVAYGWEEAWGIIEDYLAPAPICMRCKDRLVTSDKLGYCRHCVRQFDVIWTPPPSYKIRLEGE